MENSIEIKCPLISDQVVCGSCGSPNFSIDASGPRSKKRVPGICDDCGHRYGVLIKIPPKSQTE